MGYMLKIGSHVSMSGKKMLLGQVKKLYHMGRIHLWFILGLRKIQDEKKLRI